MDGILQCIIIDDDHEAINALSTLISDHEGLILQKSFTDPLLALAEILDQNEVIEIAFLDINMPLLSGLELAKRIQGKVNFVVFVTAFQEYSLKAFEVNALQYLIKPITKINLIDVISQINQLKLHQSKNAKPIGNVADDGIYILDGVKGQYLRIEIASIILFSAEKNQVHIFTETGDYIANAGISKVIADLKNDQRFMRIHKSHIINLNAINKVLANLVYLHKDYMAPISPQYRTAFFNYIQQRILKNRP
ncbi:LytTR family two component transcriptional regulator [Pedobacter psychrotolerans]|uniref:DNA-binding response regulator n=1 Tax=Pedobacter psychrotolerans TaxID=1843235 RepID=A0A4R2HLY5_9SPHI|nr:response regulator transcription factor [Pedobacter psychrotolerans]TCO31217.1 LytTR family two component transcriptional regulator [Pedobacter psychrotolerans]GGE41328.1 DNA-binding response regulator [Pedobacter psychrotolerans]